MIKGVKKNFLNSFLKSKYTFFVLVLMLVFLIRAQPPELHTIQGYVFLRGEIQAPLGTDVQVYSNSSGEYYYFKTSGPPGNTGFYSAIFQSVGGEYIIVKAFNNSHYGRRGVNLVSSSPFVTRLNITLNLSRPSEVDVNITYPANNSLFDRYQVFNLTFNVLSLGPIDALGCNASIYFENEEIVNVTSGKNRSYFLGDISVGSNKSGFFELEGIKGGTSNVVVTVLCVSAPDSLLNLYSEKIKIIIASGPPQMHAIQGYVFQADNVTQALAGTNVTINATLTGSFVSVRTSGPPGYTGFYSATIYARDGELVIVKATDGVYQGQSFAYLLNSPAVTRVNVSLDGIILYHPTFENVFVDDEIIFPAGEVDLVVGGNSTVYCSATVRDVQGYSDIVNVTAVFFDSSEATPSSPDNGNNHYSNNSCVLSDCIELTCLVNCSFGVRYYANSNLSRSWVCRLAGTDSSNSVGFGFANVSINPLLALEFPDFLDFGVVGAGEISNEMVGNVTNRGNVVIDINLMGYGMEVGDGYSMVCDDGTNISVGNIKYNLTQSNPGEISLAVFESLYKNLTSNPVNETSFDLSYFREGFGGAQKPTYWRIFFYPGAAENVSCSGYINIGAILNQ